MARKAQSGIAAPFLRGMRLLPDMPREARGEWPLTLPVLSGGFDLAFTRPVTIIVGPNGCGKSTLLEAIAAHCGFGLAGGTRHVAHRTNESEALSRYLRFSWSLKVSRGFFFRAETFGNFANLIDELASEGRPGETFAPYGGQSLKTRSHGQSVMAIFEHRLGDRGIYLLDEPEAALSPSRQIAFLKQLRAMELAGQTQVILATHSPFLMAYPTATLLQIGDTGIERVEFHETDHFRILREFYLNPDGFMAGIMMDAEEEAASADDRGRDAR